MWTIRQVGTLRISRTTSCPRLTHALPTIVNLTFVRVVSLSPTQQASCFSFFMMNRQGEYHTDGERRRGIPQKQQLSLVNLTKEWCHFSNEPYGRSRVWIFHPQRQPVSLSGNQNTPLQWSQSLVWFDTLSSPSGIALFGSQSPLTWSLGVSVAWALVYWLRSQRTGASLLLTVQLFCRNIALYSLLTPALFHPIWERVAVKRTLKDTSSCEQFAAVRLQVGINKIARCWGILLERTVIIDYDYRTFSWQALESIPERSYLPQGGFFRIWGKRLLPDLKKLKSKNTFKRHMHHAYATL